MITRRAVTLGLVAMAVPGVAQAQQVRRRAMEEIFEALSYERRTRIQQVLSAAGIYKLGIDGLYGPGTEAGLIKGARYLNRRSNNAAGIDLSTRDGIIDYYRGILTGRYAAYY